MVEPDLAQAVEQFAASTMALAEADLERPWAWRRYDEGVRAAFFRTYEELRVLAPRLGRSAWRMAGRALPPSTPWRSITPLTATCELCCWRWTTSKERSPLAQGEWPLWKVVAHILQAERAFYALTLYAVRRQHDGGQKPLEMSDEDWVAFWEGDAYDRAVQGEKLSEILAYYDDLHGRVLSDLASTSDEGFQALSPWWKGSR